ncbi:Sterile alpha motif/pointed domain [Trinorchestia longiramus]|nr:Sterile alpha motif/pointed domain [Trinorchestia longiramus]
MHPLITVINNLEMNPLYYRKCTLSFTVGRSHPHCLVRTTMASLPSTYPKLTPPTQQELNRKLQASSSQALTTWGKRKRDGTLISQNCCSKTWQAAFNKSHYGNRTFCNFPDARHERNASLTTSPALESSGSHLNFSKNAGLCQPMMHPGPSSASDGPNFDGSKKRVVSDTHCDVTSPHGSNLTEANPAVVSTPSTVMPASSPNLTRENLVATSVHGRITFACTEAGQTSLRCEALENASRDDTSTPTQEVWAPLYLHSQRAAECNTLHTNSNIQEAWEEVTSSLQLSIKEEAYDSYYTAPHFIPSTPPHLADPKPPHFTPDPKVKAELQQLQLNEYINKFTEAHIDYTSFLLLTAELLKDVGVDKCWVVLSAVLGCVEGSAGLC